MQRVSSLLPSWDKRKSSASTSTKASIERFFGTTTPSGAGGPENRTSGLQKLSTSRVVKEDFWPGTLDNECDRAARILKSFATDGYLAPLHGDNRTTSPTRESNGFDVSGSRTPIQIFKKLPPRIVQNAAGIAIFTCMRSGLWMTGSGGSGILIARKADGTWSPPSGILLHTPTLSFIMGVDVYDCVLVINSMAALEALITKPEVTLGEDIPLTNGPLVSLDSSEDHKKWDDLDDTVLTYLKARGQNQAVNLNGCILKERTNENERFYSSPVSTMQIVAGNVSKQVGETRPLFEVIKAAEGRIDADEGIIDHIAAQPAPGDAMIVSPRESPASPKSAFQTNMDDPDPFGILALEMAGMEIREAGSGGTRPSSRQYDYHSNPISPSFSKFSRQSIQTIITESNRASYMSTRTERTKMSDAHTQTDVNPTPGTTPTSQSQSEDSMEEPPSDKQSGSHRPQDDVDYTKVDLSPLRQLSGSHSVDSTAVTDSATSTDGTSRTDTSTTDETGTKASSVYTKDDANSRRGDEDHHDADDEEDDYESDGEEPVVYEVASVQPAARTAVVASTIHAKGSLVNIPKRIPPPIPMRSSARGSRASRNEEDDASILQSPVSATFSPSPRRSVDETSIQSVTPEAQSEPKPVVEKVEEEEQKAEQKAEDEGLDAPSDLKPIIEESEKVAENEGIEEGQPEEKEVEAQIEAQEASATEAPKEEEEEEESKKLLEELPGYLEVEAADAPATAAEEPTEDGMATQGENEVPSTKASTEVEHVSTTPVAEEPVKDSVEDEDEEPAPAAKNSPEPQTESEDAPLEPTTKGPGAFPSDDEAAFIPPTKNTKRQSEPEGSNGNRDASPRPISVA